MQRDVQKTNHSRCQTAMSGLLVEGTRPDIKKNEHARTHEREPRINDL